MLLIVSRHTECTNCALLPGTSGRQSYHPRMNSSCTVGCPYLIGRYVVARRMTISSSIFVVPSQGKGRKRTSCRGKVVSGTPTSRLVSLFLFLWLHSMDFALFLNLVHIHFLAYIMYMHEYCDVLSSQLFRLMMICTILSPSN